MNIKENIFLIGMYPWQRAEDEKECMQLSLRLYIYLLCDAFVHSIHEHIQYFYLRVPTLLCRMSKIVDGYITPNIFI